MCCSVLRCVAANCSKVQCSIAKQRYGVFKLHCVAVVLQLRCNGLQCVGFVGVCCSTTGLFQWAERERSRVYYTIYANQQQTQLQYNCNTTATQMQHVRLTCVSRNSFSLGTPRDMRLKHFITHCTTATHYSTLQHIATHCNTLQLRDTTTHCNTG